jgi:bifunctional non-homologous end joining protein LigD
LRFPNIEAIQRVVRRRPSVCTALLLSRVADPFDHPAWVFRLKHDGFRALAFVECDAARLVSRNGHLLWFPALCAELPKAVRATRAVLDGELVCLDGNGRPQFYDLLCRRASSPSTC